MDSGSDPDRSPVLEERIANISISLADGNTGAEEAKVKAEEEENADREKFMALVKRSRQLAEKGDIAKALQINKEALAIHYSEKLEKRIKKMEAFLTQLDDSDDENKEDMEDVGLGFKLHCSMAGKLYTHQKEGVLWLWTLFRKSKGGILADDMGLGKTIQVIAFLAGMFDMDKIKTVMIVVPLSVMPTWETEFAKWTPGINVTRFHGSSKKDRESALHKVRSRGGVMLTTYGLIVTQSDTLSKRYGREFVWDYIILDEGHKIKNKTKTSTGMNLIPAKNRIILTGTPVQNNLKELWSLFDYVHQGSLLGTVRTFKMQFETPITRARERDASAVDKRLGQEMSVALKKIIQPYFLRRTKRDVAQQGEEAQDEKCAKMPELTRKNDIVLWVHLNEMQEKIYRDFLDLDEVKALLNTKKSPLVALTVLKKICDHPRLLPTRACMKLGLDGDNFDEDDLEQANAFESEANKIDNIPDDVLVGEAGKMGILVELLDNFKMDGHKTLVFSQSRKLLDMIQRVITNRGHKVARLDGTITSLEERKEIVNKFQNNPKYSVFLLTIQVGGVGLTITAADRVIIYDPSWNPAVDAQAVDRAYRIGQTQNVVVHRLISCATVEEKIYRRQVFKDSITRQTMGNTNNPYRYFTQMELRELFTLDDPRCSKTQQQLQEMHANQRVTDESLDMHIAFLHSLDIFGISDHDLMFNDIHVRDDEEGDENEFIGHQEHGLNQDFIQSRIQRAQKMIAEESNTVLSYEERSTGVMNRFVGGRTDQPNPRPDMQPSSALFTTQVMPAALESALLNLSNSRNGAQEDSSDEVEEVEQQPTEHSISMITIDDSDDEECVQQRDMKPDVKQEIHSTHNGYEHGAAIDIKSECVQQRVKCENDMKPDVNQEIHSAHNGYQHGAAIDIKSESFVNDSNPSTVHEQVAVSASCTDNRVQDNSIEIYDDEEENDERLNESDNMFVNEDSDNEVNSSDSSSECDMNVSRRPVSLSTSHSEESRSVLHKRALQPLTQEDVDRRSPMVMRDGRHIVSEEIMISPDCNQPLIGLEASSKKKSASRSYTTTTPSKLTSCRKLNLSETQDSPKNVNVSSNSVHSPKNVNVSSNSVYSPIVLAAASPEMDAMRQLLSVENSPNVSLNTSSVRRSLSFGMESSPEITRKSGKSRAWVIDESNCEEEEDEQEKNDENSIPVIEASEDEASVGDNDDDQAEAQGAEDVEEEEDQQMDEDNIKFQDMIMIAKTLYKKKEYQESLYYVQEALTIFQEPELEVMADKIRCKLKEAQE